MSSARESSPHFYESISTLTWVAGMTQNVKLGTAILVLPLRDPRVLARQAMTLQALSGGRLMLGVGIGDYPRDFRVMQIPYDEKNRITDEYIDVLNAAFQGGHVDFNGPNISFENRVVLPEDDTQSAGVVRGWGWCTRARLGSRSCTSLPCGVSRIGAMAGFPRGLLT